MALDATPYMLFQMISAIPVAALLFFTVRAYRISGETFLINFFGGLALLETSYVFVLLNRLTGHTAATYHGTLWVQEMTQTVAFGLLAMTYYSKNRNLTAKRAAFLTIVSAGFLAAALIAYFVVPGFLELAPRSVYAFRSAAAPYFYAFNLGLLGFVLYDTSRGLAVKRQKSNLVLTAYMVLAAGQISWVYWGLTDIMAALLFANLSLVLSLGLFTLTVLTIWGGHKTGLP